MASEVERIVVKILKCLTCGNTTFWLSMHIFLQVLEYRAGMLQDRQLCSLDVKFGVMLQLGYGSLHQAGDFA